MKTILTNMCMVYKDDGRILVQDRKKKDWPGLNFPGGHVEENETITASVIREMKEETGLLIKDPLCCGAIEWYDEKNGLRHLAILFRTSSYEGELKSSSEGEVFFIKKEEVDGYPLSLDFHKVLTKCLLGLDL